MFNNMRIGFAKDIHKLVSGRKLILCGVNIPFEKGLLGHSDADVVYHAIAESILGALALGDLGTHFPDTSDEWKDVDSAIIVNKVVMMMEERNYEINNIDISVECDRPKLKNYILLMRENVSRLLKTNINNVSIKAMSNEGMGDTGNGNAIISYSFVSLKEKVLKN